MILDTLIVIGLAVLILWGVFDEDLAPISLLAAGSAVAIVLIMLITEPYHVEYVLVAQPVNIGYHKELLGHGYNREGMYEYRTFDITGGIEIRPGPRNETVYVREVVCPETSSRIINNLDCKRSKYLLVPEKSFAIMGALKESLATGEPAYNKTNNTGAFCDGGICVTRDTRYYDINRTVIDSDILDTTDITESDWS